VSVLDRRLARGALVVVGVAFCLFGPSRLATAGYANDGHSNRTAAFNGSVSSGGDHATAPRSPISLPEGWGHYLGSASVVFLVAAALAWPVVAADRRRVTFAPLATSWRRRGPPAPPE
jgi:hypothetical protein